jgi:hypothetical protein
LITATRANVMGILVSKEFKDDDKLKECAQKHSAHILQGARGEHVKKIQQALIELDGAKIDPKELASGSYGPSTARAVRAYKNGRKPPILGPGQRTADDIVGIQTISRLDGELATRRGIPRLLEDDLVKPRDIWITIRGGGNARRTNELDAIALFFNTPEYLETHATLKIISWESTYAQRFFITDAIVAEVRRERALGSRIGRILIQGSSSGGKIAVLVTNALWSQLNQAAYYLCVADGAFDRNDPLFTAPGTGVARCRRKENYYQAWSNSIDPTGETHEAMQGFHLNSRQQHCEAAVEQYWNSRTSSQQKDENMIKDVVGMVHGCAVSAGMRAAIETIRKILREEVSF